MSLTVDLVHGTPTHLALPAAAALTVDASSRPDVACVLTIDAVTGPPVELTIDAGHEGVVLTETLNTVLDVEASSAAVSTVAVNVPAVMIVEVDGCSGPPGPPGTGGGSYRHTQLAAANTWTIAHNLGFYPAVTATDSAGTIIVGDVTYTSVNVLTIDFSVPVAGFANLS